MFLGHAHGCPWHYEEKSTKLEQVIRRSRPEKIEEWPTPQGKSVNHYSLNRENLIIAGADRGGFWVDEWRTFSREESVDTPPPQDANGRDKSSFGIADAGEGNMQSEEISGLSKADSSWRVEQTPTLMQDDSPWK